MWQPVITLSVPVDSEILVGDSSKNYYSMLPKDIRLALKPGLDATVRGRNKTDMTRRFDIKVKNLPIKTFLLSLVKGTEINIVPHPDLEGNVSLDLKNVTIHDVLGKLSSAYEYDFNLNSSGYDVYKPKISSKVYKIDYLNIQRIGKSHTRVSSGQVSESGSQQTNSDTNLESNGAAAQDSSSGTEVNTVSKNSFWDDLRRSIVAIIGEEDGRSVVINAHSGVIIVRAMQSEQRSVEKYLDLTQAIISRQVLLEAKIVEVVLSDSYQTGINWAALAESGNKSLLVGQTGGGTVLNGNGLSDIAGNIGNLNPGAYLPIDGTAASAFGGAFSMAIKTADFAAFIEALETQGDVHVLSSPRVSTINNQKAIIKVGSDEFFVTDVTTETVTNNSTSQSINVELTPFFSGVALDVTPQIDNGDMVTLHIHPSVSKVNEKVKEISVSSSETFKIPLALSTIRESDSIVQAKSGQVIVIGGLMQNAVSDNSAGVPFLSDIPIIGGLFRYEKNNSRKSELVILLRPVVIKNSQQWDSILDSKITRAIGSLQ